MKDKFGKEITRKPLPVKPVPSMEDQYKVVIVPTKDKYVVDEEKGRPTVTKKEDK